MKYLLLLLAMLFLFRWTASAQCDKKTMEQCLKTIDSKELVLGTYTIDFSNANSQKEYIIGLRKGSFYKFKMFPSENASPNPIMKLLLSDALVLSSVDKGKNYKTVSFECKETHGYQLKLEGKTGCVIVVISLVK